jgi:hypothetical protein
LDYQISCYIFVPQSKTQINLSNNQNIKIMENYTESFIAYKNNARITFYKVTFVKGLETQRFSLSKKMFFETLEYYLFTPEDYNFEIEFLGKRKGVCAKSGRNFNSWEFDIKED